MSGPLRMGRDTLARIGPEPARHRARAAFDRQTPPPAAGVVTVAGEGPEVFGALLRCLAEGWRCALFARDWSAAQQTEARDALSAAAAWPAGAVLIPTGGTGGRVKFAVHTPLTLSVAARGLVARAGSGAESVCVLPAHHVGGLMQLFRAEAGEGGVLLAEWKALEASPTALPAREGRRWISLVPTQLARLLDAGRAGELALCDRVFVGGAGCAPELLERARCGRVRLCPAYGSTETAAQVCMLEPEAFLSGVAGVGEALPHARVAVDSGEIVVESAALFLGYAGAPRPGPVWRSGDAGVLTPAGLVVTGRLDELINSGGEKVAPALVEEAVRACGLAREVVVTAVPDPEWGECVGVLAVGPEIAVSEARRSLRGRLPPHALPRLWRCVDALPMTPVGKVDRRAAAQLLRSGGDWRK